MDHLQTAKAHLRARFRAYRAGLDAATYADLSARITERAAALPALQAARTVHLYWPLVERREVDTRPLIATLQRQGKTIVLPVTEPVGADGVPRMRHGCFDGEACLRINRWGLREPSGTETVPVASLDAVVVPAFGAGRNGHRIGHGSGFYDVFLRDVQAPTLCLTYAACIVDTIPAEPHDIPVSIIVTENETIVPASTSRTGM